MAVEEEHVTYEGSRERGNGRAKDDSERREILVKEGTSHSYGSPRGENRDK